MERFHERLLAFNDALRGAAESFVDFSARLNDATPSWTNIALISFLMLVIFLRNPKVFMRIGGRVVEQASFSPINLILYIMTGLGIWRLYFNFTGPKGEDNLLKFIVGEYARTIDAASAFLIHHWNASLGGWLPKLGATPFEASICLTVIPVSLRIIQIQLKDFQKEPENLQKNSWIEYLFHLAPASWVFTAVFWLFYGTDDHGIAMSFEYAHHYVLHVIVLYGVVSGMAPIMLFFAAPFFIFFMLFSLARYGEKWTFRAHRFFFPVLRLWFLTVSVAALSLF